MESKSTTMEADDQTLTDIYLHGALGDEFGKHWRLAVNSAAEAVRALSVLRPNFLPAVERLNAQVEGYHVQVGEFDLGNEQLMFPSEGREIHITPLLQGADMKGILQIVAGIVIIAAAIYLGPIGIGAISGTLAMQIGLFGAVLALGGIARLLSSTPSIGSQDKKKQKSTYAFSGIVNTAGQGECVPVCFGEMIVGSVVVSAGSESADVTGGGGTGGGGVGSQGGGGSTSDHTAIP